MNKEMKKCDTHPKYNGERKPRVDCISCWRMYKNGLEDQPKDLDKLNKEIQRWKKYGDEE